MQRYPWLSLIFGAVTFGIVGAFVGPVMVFLFVLGLAYLLGECGPGTSGLAAYETATLEDLSAEAPYSSSELLLACLSVFRRKRVPVWSPRSRLCSR